MSAGAPTITPARLAALRRLALYGEIQVGARTGRTLAYVFAEDLVLNGLAVFVGPRRIAINEAGKAAAPPVLATSDGREESTRPAASRGETLPPSEDPSPGGSADA